MDCREGKQTQSSSENPLQPLVSLEVSEPCFSDKVVLSLRHFIRLETGMTTGGFVVCVIQEIKRQGRNCSR